MMWAPNYGGGYPPFTGGQFEALPGTEDHRALDTDGNGRLTMADDSYEPYYPGDEYVDWAASRSTTGGAINGPGGGTTRSPPRTRSSSTCSPATIAGPPGTTMRSRTSIRSTGSSGDCRSGSPRPRRSIPRPGGGAAEVDIKRAWWGGQVFSNEFHADHPPQVKMINWFEWEKYEVEIDDTVDWRAADSPNVAEQFRTDLPTWVLHADDLPCAVDPIRGRILPPGGRILLISADSGCLVAGSAHLSA